MIRFNSDNLVVGEIKQILSSFNLPNAIVLKDETTYIPNKIYIKDNAVYRSSFDGNTLNRIENLSYDWGDELRNITHTYKITSNIYDVDTHKYLGNYLRWIRDYRGLNLMSMYNCFSTESPVKFSYTFYTEGTVKREFDVSDPAFKIYMIPLKLGQKYTMSLSTTRPVEMVCGYYAHNKILKMFPETYLFKRSCLFNESFIYDKVVDLDSSGLFTEDLYYQEDNLYMFLKLPVRYESSIVILEGDFTNNMNVFLDSDGYTEVMYTASATDQYKHNYSFKDTPSRLQLMSCRSDESYPFADKLIQYLFSNVIDKTEHIQNNIKKVQTKLEEKGYLPYIKKYGIWTEDVSAACRLCSHKNVNHREVYKDYDCIGYFDGDIESEVGGLE